MSKKELEGLDLGILLDATSPYTTDPSPQQPTPTLFSEIKAPSGPVRKRAPKACGNCRARRVRCNLAAHGMPCSNCKHYETNCRLPVSKRKAYQMLLEAIMQGYERRTDTEAIRSVNSIEVSSGDTTQTLFRSGGDFIQTQEQQEPATYIIEPQLLLRSSMSHIAENAICDSSMTRSKEVNDVDIMQFCEDISQQNMMDKEGGMVDERNPSDVDGQFDDFFEYLKCASWVGDQK